MLINQKNLENMLRKNRQEEKTLKFARNNLYPQFQKFYIYIYIYMEKDKVINLVGYIINILSNNLNIAKYFLIKDKSKTIKFLKSRNFPTTERIEKKSVLINDYVVVKPNSRGSGNGIHFFKPGKKVPLKYVEDDNYFFERYAFGTNYRIIIYKGEIITIFERTIPNVVGNGKDSVRKLVNVINKTRSSKNSIILDSQIDDTYIPKLKETINCNNLCNYSTGGGVKNIDLSSIPSNTKDVFVKLSKDIGLPIFSIDLIATDITREIKMQDSFCINELEYCNDWDVNYILRDKFYFLSKYLVVKWILYIIILKKVCNILYVKRAKVIYIHLLLYLFLLLVFFDKYL